ncbi:adhesion G protein-coupled receptor L2-like isoform X1 [Pocillopora verrucosa]|uniref:adhesion G protein-coupled receptor L2-like isoform X1 n=1 Tax=Pocillopora verrucosa TaxID=203993 RepID=UPI00333F1167
MNQAGQDSTPLRFQMLLTLLVHFFQGDPRSRFEKEPTIIHERVTRCVTQKTHSSNISYEKNDLFNSNWTSALSEYPLTDDAPVARIESIEQLCDAQTKLSSDLDYWTALKRNNLGLLQWGLLPTNSVDVSLELLDRTGPADRCYAISKSAMKLKSMNCSSALPVLTSYPREDPGQPDYGEFSDHCLQYMLSKCSRSKGTHINFQALQYSWSSEEHNGTLVGSCQIEDTLLNCCQTYCRQRNDIYYIDTGSDLDTKLRKVPKGISSDVEMSFDINNNSSESRLVRIIINHKVFKDAGRVIAVLLHQKASNEDSLWTYNRSSYRLISDVVGVVLDPPQNETIQNKIIIHFSHNEPSIDPKAVERKCVFWIEDFSSSNGSWSTDGCTVLNDSSMLSTVCSCNHLTNFAVLMQYKDIKEDNIPPEHRRALLIITYIGCSLSLVGEVMVIFVYVTFMKIKDEGIQVRLNLCTALFLAQLVFLSGIDATSNKSVCILVAVLLHYFYLAAFGWMLLEGVFLYVMIVEVFNTVDMRYLYFFGWGFPIIPIVISLIIGSSGEKGLESYTNENFCWLSFQKRLSWAFIVPVLFVTIINFVILMAVLREIRNLHEPNPSKMKTFRKTLKSFLILSPLLGLTWVFGLLAVTDAGLVFQYVFTILNSTQGMLIFLLHVLRNSEVRAAFRHKMLKWRFNTFHRSSSGRSQAGVYAQYGGQRKRQIDPEETKKELSHNTTSKEQIAFITRLPPPSVH